VLIYAEPRGYYFMIIFQISNGDDEIGNDDDDGQRLKVWNMEYGKFSCWGFKEGSKPRTCRQDRQAEWVGSWL
jgi:hypothetical protein